jgi:hypothetical protein
VIFFEQAELRDSLYPLLPVLLSGLFTVFVLAMQSLADLFSNRTYFQQTQSTTKGASR